jgi:hypothetical protein
MTKEDLTRVLQADLGKNYDPLEALKFLKILEKETNPISAENLSRLLDEPPETDIPLQVIYKTPYVLGEVVLSGQNTRKKHPLCNYHPVHFKKTYLQKFSRWETNPLHEAKQSHKVWVHFQETEDASDNLLTNTTQNNATRTPVPLPLGACSDSFRSQIIVGKSLGSLSPIRHTGDANATLKQILEARKIFQSHKQQDYPMRLWDGLVSLDKVVNNLHTGGFLHNDLHKENLLLQDINGKYIGSIIDFETTEENELFDTSQWLQETMKDKKDLIKESCFIYLCLKKEEKIKLEIDPSNLLKNVKHYLKSDPLMIFLEKSLNKG